MITRKGTKEYDEVRALMGGSDKVIMPRKEYKKEHKRLIEVLETGTKAERMAEARRQKREEIEEVDKFLKENPKFLEGYEDKKDIDKRAEIEETDAFLKANPKFLKGYKDKAKEKTGPKMRKKHKEIMEVLREVLGKLQMD